MEGLLQKEQSERAVWPEPVWKRALWQPCPGGRGPLPGKSHVSRPSKGPWAGRRCRGPVGPESPPPSSFPMSGVRTSHCPRTRARRSRPTAPREEFTSSMSCTSDTQHCHRLCGSPVTSHVNSHRSQVRHPEAREKGWGSEGVGLGECPPVPSCGQNAREEVSASPQTWEQRRAGLGRRRPPLLGTGPWHILEDLASLET